MTSLIQENPKHTKVLIVDDDATTRQILLNWLTKEGFDVSLAEDGQEAIEQVESDTPDFLITDWRMPGMSGIDLCKAVRRLPLPSYLYITFLTALSGTDDIVEALQAGADDFLCKPVRRNELIARLQAGQRILRLESLLSRQAQTDSLTGLLNRGIFLDISTREFIRARRHGHPLTFIMVDLDFFKRINDTYGHQFGDVALARAAELLESIGRQSDVVCRYGGEEFCILLDESDEEGGYTWAERARRALAQIPLFAGDKEINLTASFGVAEMTEQTGDYSQVIARADEALLFAKKSGRNCVVTYRWLSEYGPMDSATAPDGGSLCMLESTRARDIMIPVARTIRETETIRDIITLFRDTGLTYITIVDHHGRYVDLFRRSYLLPIMENVDNWDRAIAEFRRPETVTFSEDTPVTKIHHFMARSTVPAVLIVTDGRPVGIVDSAAMLDWFKQSIDAAEKCRT